MSTDRFNVNVSLSRNWEHLAAKFVGTGSPDTTKAEFADQHARDTAASLLGHPDAVAFIAAAEGVTTGRAKYELLMEMAKPLPPAEGAAAKR